jgi:hypothetical protein
MPVHVGIDVHRKRSQAAAVTKDGYAQLSKNMVNGPEPMLRLTPRHGGGVRQSAAPAAGLS